MLETYRSLFVQRTDAYSRQRRRERRYYHVGKPLTDDVLRSHLKGELTIGLYSVDPTGHTKWSVIDSDNGVQPLQDIGQELTDMGIPSYLELSRAGGHRWIFWGRPIPPSMAKKILSPYSKGYELFPAGDIPDEEGFGLAIRAPLGVHQLTGERYPFVAENGERAPSGVARGQLQWLKEHVIFANVERLAQAPSPEGTMESPKPSNGLETRRDWTRLDDPSPIQAFNETHHIRDVVGQYTRLSRSGMAQCPHGELHKENDRHKSFIVYEKTQKFWCFRCRKGGDAATFIMWAEGIDAKVFYQRYCQKSDK